MRDELSRLVGQFTEAHVWVLGDVMLDEYLAGEVGRISPEAPVPVVSVQDRFSRLGGAANVARSVAALGARVSLCGVIGEDKSGADVIAACQESGIDTRALGRSPGRPTTRKVRVLGQGQQLLRMDWEETHPVDEALSLARELA